MKQLFVIGEGAWGTAVATVLAENNHHVLLWCHDKSIADTIVRKRVNERYLPGITLSERIIPVTDFSQIKKVDWIFEAIPVQYMRTVLEQVNPLVTPSQRWVLLSKGIEQDSLLLPSALLDDVLGYDAHKVVLSGPSFAKDLAQKYLTAVMVASSKQENAQQAASLVANAYCKTFISDDLVGVQVGGAFKNVIALALGMLTGAKQADNVKAFAFTQGLYEILLLARALGGHEQTVYGLSGVGDLVLTALSTQSRNFYVGSCIGAGESLDAVLSRTGYIPEGVNTVKSVYQLMQQKKLKLPLCTAVYGIIFEQKQVTDLVTCLADLPQK